MAGGRFHQEGDSGGDFLEEFFGLFGDHFEAEFFALFHVGAHVADDEWDFESCAASEFAGEGFAGLGGLFRFGGTEIDEVAVVADDGLGVEVGFCDCFSEFLGRIVSEGFAVPLLG